jgi:alpha-beta hydrolase superfamily lysophospholipase
MNCRSFLALLAACACFACAPNLATRGPAPQVPAIENGDFIARDGLRLPLRHWDAQNPKAVIVALHGMSDYSEAFDMPGPWWAFNGIAVYAYDQRGFGGAPNPGIWAGGDAMRGDLDDFVDAVQAKYPGIPVYALGESMGGAVVLSALAGPHPPHIAGAILVAPAVWSRDDMPLSYSATLWLAAHTVPWMHVSGEGLKIWPSDNLPMLRRLSRDPLYQHKARTDQVYGLANLMDEARAAPAHLQGTTPILFLHGAKDQVIPRASADATIQELGAHADARLYPNGYHMLLRDLYGEKVWYDIVQWIDKTSQSATAAPGR